MKKYTQRVAFFLDILGFKEIVRTGKLSVDEILKRFDMATYQLNNDLNYIKKHRNCDRQYLQVSDSIILSFSCNFPSALFVAILDIMRLQACLAAFKGVFLRGGCAMGNLYHRENTIFGIAMNDAFEMEKNAKYPRVIIPHKIIDFCAQYTWSGTSSKEEKEQILKCLKLDQDGYYYIDYISYGSFGTETDSDEQWLQYMQQLKQKIQEGLYEQVALQKYVWLKEKYNAAVADWNENTDDFKLLPITDILK